MGCDEQPLSLRELQPQAEAAKNGWAEGDYGRAANHVVAIKEVLAGGEELNIAIQMTRHESVEGSKAIERKLVLVVLKLPATDTRLQCKRPARRLREAGLKCEGM